MKDREDHKFLRDIARYYSGRYVGRLTLVFPNKRGAMFMRRYLRQELKKNGGGIMPVIKVLPSYLARESVLSEISVTEQKFILYRCYLQVMAEMEMRDKARDFDAFAFWADVILSDFDDLDANMVDAKKLFHNLESLKEIQSNFLTQEQADAYEQLWGYRPAGIEDVEAFWRHVHPQDNDMMDGSDRHAALTDEFYGLWRILGRLYDALDRYMIEHGIGYRGKITRDAVNRIIERGADADGEHVAFIGFDHVPGAVRYLFDYLYRVGAADFFWDIPIFDYNVRMLKGLASHFKMPDDFEYKLPESYPVIDVVSVASNYMQAKIAANVIKRLGDQGHLDLSRPDNTVVVMPDANMLAPLLYALDDGVQPVNVTMGLPLRDTPAGTLMKSLVSLHLRSRIVRGVPVLFHEDVMAIVSHPVMRAVSAQGCDLIAGYITEHRLFTIRLDEILNQAPQLSFVFNVPAVDASATDTARYVRELITGMSASDNSSRDFLQVLEAYGQALVNMLELATRYEIPMGGSTFMIMLERLIYPLTLKVNGHPVTGLQVMGVLETRSLDFENIIFMSLNERVYPRRNPLRTLLPHILRSAYRMTTIEQAEAQAAYYFYRLLTRSSRVVLLYDDRPTGQSAGERSRFITQLIRLLPKGVVNIYNSDIPTVLPEGRTVEISKTGAVADKLKTYIEGQGDEKRELSASSLKNLLKCPLLFYFKNVCRLNDEDDNGQFMSDATFGTVVHEVFGRLFAPYKNHVIDAEVIDKMLQADIQSIALAEMNVSAYRGRYDGAFGSMPGEARVMAEHVERMVRHQLSNLKLKPDFTYLGSEVKLNGPMTIHVDGHDCIVDGVDKININFTGSIDRLDRLSDGRLRIVDYKTGGDSNIFRSVDDLFSTEHSCRNDAVFQLLTYSLAAHEILNVDGPINAELYRLRRGAVDQDTSIRMGSMTKNTVIPDDRDQLVSGFADKFNDLVATLFDPSIPFTQTDDRDNCRYCTFKDICVR